jgi:hypothetical protein
MCARAVFLTGGSHLGEDPRRQAAVISKGQLDPDFERPGDRLGERGDCWHRPVTILDTFARVDRLIDYFCTSFDQVLLLPQ